MTVSLVMLGDKVDISKIGAVRGLVRKNSHRRRLD